MTKLKYYNWYKEGKFRFWQAHNAPWVLTVRINQDAHGATCIVSHLHSGMFSSKLHYNDLRTAFIESDAFVLSVLRKVKNAIEEAENDFLALKT